MERFDFGAGERAQAERKEMEPAAGVGSRGRTSKLRDTCAGINRAFPPAPYISILRRGKKGRENWCVLTYRRIYDPASPFLSTMQNDRWAARETNEQF